jgi:predicted transcriptional regulator
VRGDWLDLTDRVSIEGEPPSATISIVDKGVGDGRGAAGSATTCVPDATKSREGYISMHLTNIRGTGPMSIKISAELAARLRGHAARHDQEPDAAAEALLTDWQAWERADAIAGIRRGLEASDAGRVFPAAEVFASLRSALAGDQRSAP